MSFEERGVAGQSQTLCTQAGRQALESPKALHLHMGPCPEVCLAARGPCDQRRAPARQCLPESGACPSPPHALPVSDHAL